MASIFKTIITHAPPRRYAETQQASNGGRYRDWVCLLYSGESMAVEKARLESHVIQGITETYDCSIPWGAQHTACIRSSLPVSTNTLDNLTGPTKTDCSFDAFSRAVRTHFSSGKTRLPVRDPSRDFIARVTATSNPAVVIYSDPTCQQLLVVYSPKSAPLEPATSGPVARLEFIQLVLVPAVKA